MAEGIEEGRTEAEKQAIKNMLQRFSPEEIIELGYDKNLVMEIVENHKRSNG